jgi:hypothetical protein
VKKRFLKVRHEKRWKLIRDSLWDSEEQACRSLRQRVIDTQTSGYGTPVALLRVRGRQSVRVYTANGLAMSDLRFSERRV